MAKNKGHMLTCNEAVEKLGGSFDQNNVEIGVWSLKFYPNMMEKLVLKESIGTIVTEFLLFWVK